MSCPFLPPPAQNGISAGQSSNIKTKNVIILGAQFGLCQAQLDRALKIYNRSTVLLLMARMAEQSSEKEILQHSKESVLV